MGLLNRAGMAPAPPPMQGGGQGDPMMQIVEMLRAQGVPVDQMPPQQLQQLIMQMMQGGGQGAPMGGQMGGMPR